jgi:hypothetical protein
MLAMKPVICLLGLLAVTPFITGCGVASAPIKNTPQVATIPIPGEVSVSSKQADSVGSVTPVYVSVANGTDISRSVVPSQVFAIDGAGERIAPLPPGEAARQAGGAGELKAALGSAAVSGVAGGAIGAAAGAVAGAVSGGVAHAAGLGGAIGGGYGAFTGAPAGQQAAHRQAEQQLTALALRSGEVRKDFTVSGYVFFPKGDYKGLEMLLVNSENGDTEVIKTPWR